jgi:ribonuclease D
MKWIASQRDFDAALARLDDATSIAVDTEADSLHSYFDKVCLIQISVPGEDLIIDPLAKIDIGALGRIMANPGVTKVLHGADYDLRILNRDFGFEATNLIDTMICSQLLGYDGIGLAALLKKHFGLDLDKSHQRADWAMRPLTSRMLEYAATDTRHLIELSSILRRELEAAGRWDWAREEFSRLESIRFRASDEDQAPYGKIKGASTLDRRNLAALARLYNWRDQLARAADRPPFKIASNEMLIEIAKTLPRDRDALSKVKGVSSFHLSKYSRQLLGLVEESVNVPESELPEKVSAKPWIRDRKVEAAVERLKKIRDTVATELRIDPAVLAPKHILTAIASIEPSSVDDLRSIPAMREWQRRVIGPALMEGTQSSIAFKR